MTNRSWPERPNSAGSCSRRIRSAAYFTFSVDRHGDIEHCTVKAPGYGIVVDANQSLFFGLVDIGIGQGVTVSISSPASTTFDQV